MSATKPRSTIYLQHAEDPSPAIAALRASLLPGEFVAFDIESNALWASDPRDRITSIQVGSKNVAVLLDPTDPQHIAAARDVLNDPAYRLTAHNAGFDILRLKRAGVFDSVRSAWDRTTDTLILARLMTSGEKTGNDLKSLTAAWCGDDAASQDAKDALKGVQKTMKTSGVGAASTWSPYKKITVDRDGTINGDPEDGNTWARIPRDNSVFQTYCAADVYDSAHLAEALDPIVRSLYPDRVAAEHRIARMVCEMTDRGMRFDLDAARTLLADAHTRRDAAAAELLSQFNVDMSYVAPKSSSGGGDETAEALSRDKIIADAIRAEGIEVPTKRNGNGKYAPTLDKRAVKKYDGEGSKVAPLYRAWKKADQEIRTYLEPYLKACPVRMHADIQAAEARTGRMACSKPNLQNVPAMLKPCFLADDGMVLISADFSSVEMRVAAAVTGDPELCRMYTEPLPDGATERQKRERDPYWQIAWQVWGDDATEDDRKLAKIVVLANMYGGGAEKIAAQVDIAPSLCANILTGYRKRFPKLKAWFDAEMLPRIVAGEPFWTLPSGRWQQIDPTRAWAGLNLMIQGLARDLLLGAMFRLEDAGFGDAMLLPIHDEVLFQIPAGDAEAAVPRISAVMESAFQGVPITVEAKVLGPRWIEKTDKPKPSSATPS